MIYRYPCNSYGIPCQNTNHVLFASEHFRDNGVFNGGIDLAVLQLSRERMKCLIKTTVTKVICSCPGRKHVSVDIYVTMWFSGSCQEILMNTHRNDLYQGHCLFPSGIMGLKHPWAF